MSLPKTHLKQLLSRPVRVSIKDGRIFTGQFVGTDKPLNILLADTEEYRPAESESLDLREGRFVGLVLIPWRLVVKVETRTEELDPGPSSDPPLDHYGLYF